MGEGSELREEPTQPRVADDGTVADETRDAAAKVPGGAGTSFSPPSTREDERYVDEGRLGFGAMGAVHLCHDRVVGRRVARKAMHPAQRTDASLRRRFEHEARIQGQLEHPAIVPVYDVVVGADGVEYFTMRRVEGRSLRQILKLLREEVPAARQRYGIRRLLAAFATVCLAIAFAHKRGIVHRDIKPSNIMLGDYGEVYVLDWGIARVLGEDGSGERRVSSIILPSADDDDSSGTEVGDLIGTMGYMAPEQARGLPAGPPADVYALAATLFEILTLERLHSQDPLETMKELRRGVEARPSRRAPEQRVAPELEDLCVRATSRDPDARPDAQAMHDSIQEFLDGERDQERRAQLAAQHVEVAREELARVFAGGAEAGSARERALEAIHRAHALDAGNEEAAKALQALIRAPMDVSGQVDAALASTTIASRRVAMRTGPLLLAVWLLGTASVALLGVRSWPLLALEMVLVVIGGSLMVLNAHAERPFAVWAFLALANGMGVGVAAAFTWFVVAPGILTFIAVSYALVNRPTAWYREHQPVMRHIRAATLLFGPLGVVAVVVLEALEIIPRSIVFRDGNIVMIPRVVDYPETRTLLFLAIVNVALIVGPALLVLRHRDSLFAMERRVFDLAARLRELVPAEARRAAPSITPLESDAERRL